MVLREDTINEHCVGCLKPFSHCKFGQPYNDGKTCLRESLDAKMSHFITEIYPYYSRGIYPSGNVWTQDNKLIELTEIADTFLK